MNVRELIKALQQMDPEAIPLVYGIIEGDLFEVTTIRKLLIKPTRFMKMYWECEEGEEPVHPVHAIVLD